ncbi:hypothetical protein ACM66B_005186 [Microbotryomycetes sp. NB124-2]
MASNNNQQRLSTTTTGQPVVTRPVTTQTKSVRHHETVQHSGSSAPAHTAKANMAAGDNEDSAMQQHPFSLTVPLAQQLQHRPTGATSKHENAIDFTPSSAEYSEIHLAPATRTSVVTTTTTTTVHFAPILVPRSNPIRQRHSSFTSSRQPPATPQSSLLQFLESEEARQQTGLSGDATELDPKLFPLSQTSYPGSLRRFKLKLGNVDGTFYEGGREASTSARAGAESSRRTSAAEAPYEIVDDVGQAVTGHATEALHADKRKNVLALSKGTLHSRRAAARRSRTSAANSQSTSAAAAAASHPALVEQDEIMADDTAQLSPGPPRKRPRESPPSPAAEPAEAMSFADRNELAPLSPGSLQHASTANIGSLPSPNMSPPSPVPTFSGDHASRADIDADIDDEIGQLDFGSGHALGSLSALPDLVHSFDKLPPQLQSYFIFTLLKRSSVPVLQTINNIIAPALRRDFLTDLPPELSVHILGFLDHQSLCRASVVCRGWRKLTDGEWRVWKQRLVQDELWVGDGSEEKEAAEIMNGRKENLFLKRWRAGVWEQPSLTSWTGKADDVFDLAEIHSAGGRRMSNVRLASPSSSREASPFGSSHFIHPYKTLYRRRYLVRRNWQAKAPVRTTFSCNSNSVITSLQFDKDKVVSASDDHSINVFDTRTGARKARLSDHDGGVWALQYIGNVLVSGSTDRTVRVWDLDRARCTHTFVGHTSTVRCLQIVEPENINPDRSGPPVWEPPYPMIVTGSRDWSLRVWKLPLPGRDAEYHPVVPQSPTDENIDPSDNPYHLRHLAGHRHAVRALAARGRTLVSGSYDCSVRVWDILTGECKHRLQGHTQKVYSVVYDHQRQQCASGSMDGTVRLWSTETGECINMLDGHSSLVGLLGLSHKHLVSAAADSTLRVWDPETGTYRHTLAAHSGAITCFQHDAHKVVSGSDGTLKMWDVNDGTFTRDLITGLTGVWQVAFDERFCVAAVQRGGQSEFEVMDFGAVDDHETSFSGIDEDKLEHDSASDDDGEGPSTYERRSTASIASSTVGQRRSNERLGRPELRIVPDVGVSSTATRGRVVRRTPSTRNLAAAVAAAASGLVRRRGSISAATQTPENQGTSSSRLVAPNAPRLGALDDDEVLSTAATVGSNAMHVDDMDQDVQER